MKKTVAYICYFISTAAAAIFVEILLSYLMMGILFTAADSSPGDLSETGKLLYSVAGPVLYASLLFVLYFVFVKVIDSKNSLMINMGSSSISLLHFI